MEKDVSQEGAQTGQQSGQSQGTLSISRLEFLSNLPMLLNSSLNPKLVIQTAMTHVRKQLAAEAYTVFLLNQFSEELTFWALSGDADPANLKGKKMPSKAGVVGWVIQNKQSALINDVANDPRFFKQVDKESKFETKNMVCVPLTGRGQQTLGAVQILNAKAGNFSQEDLLFTERFAHQLALAIDNALLYERAMDRSQKLKAIDLKKNEMITVIAHEFRTPLNIIQGSADMLRSDDLKDQERENMAELLLKGVSRLTKLITNVRNLSLVENEELVVEKQPVMVSSLVDNCKATFEEVVKGPRTLELIFDVSPEAKSVLGDQPLLIVVLHNLISNAIRFTQDGGMVIVKVEPTHGLVRFSVTDNGIGIAKEAQAAIFEKFYEVTSAAEHKSGNFEFKSCGLGLGLPTIKRILTAHGSTIEVESEEGKGSSFWFYLKTA